MLHLPVFYCVLYSIFLFFSNTFSSFLFFHSSFFLYTNTTTSWSYLNSELLCHLIFAILVVSILLSQVCTSAIRIHSISWQITSYKVIPLSPFYCTCIFRHHQSTYYEKINLSPQTITQHAFMTHYSFSYLSRVRISIILLLLCLYLVLLQILLLICFPPIMGISISGPT